jgi:L-ribulose-5-phosphate 3-epimerase
LLYCAPMKRRQFLSACLAAAAAARLEAADSLRIGHRQASMTREPGPAVFDLARRIPGLSGVELQVHFQKTTLWDADTLQAYKRGAENAGLLIPSLAGIWSLGASLHQPGPAEEMIRKSIGTAEALKSKVILIAAFNKNCPDMGQEESYGPVVALLQKLAPVAAAAGVTLGLETSLAPAGDKKLIDLVAHPAVKVYYDADNVEFYGHTGAAVAGYSLLGRPRIAQLHLKNQARLLEEPGRVDWRQALQAIRQIGYEGWIVFETAHTGPEQCIEATTKNITFVRRQLARD